MKKLDKTIEKEKREAKKLEKEITDMKTSMAVSLMQR